MGEQPIPNEDKQIVTLGRVLQTLREEDNVDVLIETTVSYLQTELNYSLIWIGFYDRLDHRILGKGGITPTGGSGFLNQRFFLNPGDLLEQVVIQQRPIGVPDLQEETRAGEWRKAAQTFNIRGTLIYPIRYRDRCFGLALLGQEGWGISPRADEKARLSILLGGLAAALNQIETDWQHQQAKRPDEPLLALLNELRTLPTMWQRLEVVVSQTHAFVKPTRTNIYWFEPEKRYFWRRVGNRTTSSIGGKDSAAGITVQEAGGFYKAMVRDQVVSIGEAHSSLKADLTSRLLQRLGVRSLLAAPILLQDELLGFLAVEGNDPRIWQEQEKSFVRGAAQLVALIAPIERMEATIEQTKQDQILTAELARAIASEQDWQATLKTCADNLSHRLQQARFLVLLFDSESGKFEICYQNHPANRQPLGASLRHGKESHSSPLKEDSSGIAHYLPALNEVDWQFVSSTESVEIEDLTADLKLTSWREGLLEAGVRSLLISRTSSEGHLEGLLAFGYETPRTWTHAERELIRVVAQQIGLIVHQWQLQRQVLSQQKIFQSLQWGLSTLASAQPLLPTQVTPDTNLEIRTYEGTVLQPIAQMLACPLVALVAWSPGEQVGRIVAGVIANQQFAVNLNAVVPIDTDKLIQAALVEDSLVIKRVDQLSPDTRQWLIGSGIGEILVMALRTAPEYEPTGVVVVADKPGRRWSEMALPAFGLLVTQLAWFRRYLMLAHHLQSQRQELERLNWYKHRSMEDFHRCLEAGVKVLSQLDSKEPEILQTRVRQICQQLSNSLLAMGHLLSTEEWKMRSIKDLGELSKETISLTTLLKRALERIDPLLKERRLWSQLHEIRSEHNQKIPISFSGELFKIELILYEVLSAAGDRAPQGGKIDIWYRIVGKGKSGNMAIGDLSEPMLNPLLELSITDNGVIDPQLIAEFRQRPWDELAPSSLNQPPGLQLRICQSLVQQIGGKLKLYQVEDGRILTRLLLPLIVANG
ncbi:GAF domain-containing protein [Microseira sp. BLCC-F43]|jgi:GAF domain-containing protein|uniref:sensor histidine kinase n=1 Tax=Microseira sp. BLCC-F43 TaxID=3153602 RepID=UPI0035BB6A9D